MRRSSSFGLGLSVCGAVAALAVSPAYADDGATNPADPSAIVAAVAAAVPSMSEPQGPAAPQLPTAPETPVIPSVSAAVPHVIPPAEAPAAAPQAPSTPPPSTPVTPTAPVVAPQPEPSPAPQPTPAATPLPAPSDTGNTTVDNSNGITTPPSTTAPQTFIWNWYWNCKTDEAVPSVPSPPAGATTIILNWHWACADPPPQLDVAGATICVACNIAISVRVGSPGDTGNLAQTIAAQTQATAAGVTHTIQSALQAVPQVATPVPPTPPAVVPPGAAPPVGVAALISQAQLFPIDLGPFVAPLDTAAADDPPLHGAPSVYGAALAPAPLSLESQGVAGDVASLAALRASTSLPSNLPSPQRSIVGRAGAGSRSPAGTRRPAHRPVPPAIP